MSSGGLLLVLLVVLEGFVDGSGDVTFEDADGFSFGFASCHGRGDEGFGGLVVGELGDGDTVDDRVEVSVAACALVVPLALRYLAGVAQTSPAAWLLIGIVLLVPTTARINF